MIRASTAWRAVSELLFPRLCPACEAAGAAATGGMCPACHRALADNFGQHYCPLCGTTAGPYAANDGRCSVCRDRPWSVGGTARLGAHQGRLRELLLAFKYGRRDELDRFFGGQLAGELQRTGWFDQVEGLTAVPTCWQRRLLGRPYVAIALARETARATKLPNLPLLRRIRRERSQIGLTYTQRIENVRGAFRVAPGVRLDQAVICLVDDVATTGATLAECARVLKRAGAAKVFAAVICKQEGGLGIDVPPRSTAPPGDMGPPQADPWGA